MGADLVLVGGGLANGLIAYRLSQTRPDISFQLLERDSRLGGLHTWSFNTADLTAAQLEWIGPFVEHEWPGYEVRFPDYTRWLDSGYQSITSDRFHEVLSNSLGECVTLNADVRSISADSISLTDGTVVKAAAVVDGRGPAETPHLVIRFQKFVGQVLRLRHPHRLRGPVLMDATVEQLDGYRFVYVLPFGDDLALVEDTRYSDSPVLERSEYVAAIEHYVEAQGWEIEGVVNEEQGVLPVALSGQIEAFWDDGKQDVARAGLRAALFHPTTGYSLPNAVRLAELVATILPASGRDLYDAVRRESVAHWRGSRFFRMLNRMLFLAAC